MTTLCQCDAITHFYDEKSALADVSISLKSGEVLALLGENGAGKTTLINTLLGVLKPDSGKASIKGFDVCSSKVKIHRAAMLQVANLPDTLTIKEHIRLFQSYYLNPLPIEEVLKLSRLEAIATRRSKNLSGGEKQRLMFALAICGNTDVLFLDEPSVGMDVSTRRQMWHAIEALKAKGKAILLTTHYLDEADVLADKIAILHLGKLLHQGTKKDVKALTTGGTIHCHCELSAAVIASLPDVTAVKEQNALFEITTRDVNTTLSALQAKSANISQLNVTSATLEQVLHLFTQPIYDMECAS